MTRLVLTNGRIFDGTGADPAVGDIVMEDGLIADVGSGLDGDESIDCRGKLITPGIFDCHVHFMADGDFSPNTHLNAPFSLQFYLAAKRMQRTLAAGVTTVREAGGADLGVKEARELGLIPGPRMQISLTMLSQTGGHGDSWEVCGGFMPGMMDEHPGRPHNIVDGPEEMRRKVRELVRAGADVIKCATSGGVISPRSNPSHAHFRDDELDAMVAEASAAGRHVMAHAQATDGIKTAIRAGIRSIEHGIWLDDEAIEMMLEAGTYLVPTLIAPMGVIDAADRGADVADVILNKARAVVEDHQESVGRAIGAGVKIAMGTDSGVTPHGENLRELAAMANLGMTPGQVLASSTSIAAELMGIEDEVGTLQPGMAADVVVFAGDDFDVTNLGARVETVIQAGSVHP
ncbi:MAG: amidohydrolase family protein [Actinomycetia bacterium]|nr:amidohydrolase family protein [Actinomycetes bacterium]